MQAVLIRHGQTAGNAQSRYIGRTDEPLSPWGRAAAGERGGDSAVQQVYVSPLRRTGETAAILFPRARQIVVPELREMDFGVFEGRSPGEMEQDAAYRAWVESECLAPCPGGESRAAFQRRAVAAFAGVLSDARRQGTQTAVFVVHGGVIMAVLEALALPQRSFYCWHVPNLGGWTAQARWEAGRWVLVSPRPYPGP